jgi:hypothetical protein
MNRASARAFGRVVPLLVLVASLGACGEAPGDGSGTLSGTGPAAAPGQDGTGGPTATRAGPDGHVCLAQGTTDLYGSDLPTLERPRLPAGVPARFVRCRFVEESIAGHGRWGVRIEDEAVGGVAELAAALHRRDESSAGAACDAYGELWPDLWAVDAAGGALLVRLPVDGCAHIQPAVRAALERVVWRETGRRRLSQTVPQAALDSGCETGWKDMAAVDAGHTGSDGSAAPAGTADALATASGGNVCVYRIDERGQTPSGSFLSGRALRGAEWAAVVRALDATPRLTAACATPATRFAVVRAQGPDPAYVELDGCRRVLLPGSGELRRAPGALVRLLMRA